MESKPVIYKVSYVVLGGQHPGAIKNQTTPPTAGDKVRLGRKTFEIVEVHQLVPPREDFYFLHATLRPVGEAK